MLGRAASKALIPTHLGDAWTPEVAQTLAHQSFARAQDFYRRSAAISQGGARLWADVAETAWANVRVLNEKVARSFAVNAEAAFDAAEACARADSLEAIVTLQGEFVRRLVERTSEQTREFVDLSVRASQHLFETIEDAAVRLMRMDF